MGYGVCFVHVTAAPAAQRGPRWHVGLSCLSSPHHGSFRGRFWTEIGLFARETASNSCDVWGCRSDGVRSQIIVTTALEALWTAHGAQRHHGGSDKLI